jgi:hypothetical protein
MRDFCYFCAGLIPEAHGTARTGGVSGGLYDVITRGNQRQMIFRDDRDREKYLEILASLKNQFFFRISAYAQIESRLGIDKKIKKDIDEIVFAVENGKYRA